jgi:hypothetical protein
VYTKVCDRELADGAAAFSSVQNCETGAPVEEGREGATPEYEQGSADDVVGIRHTDLVHLRKCDRHAVALARETTSLTPDHAVDGIQEPETSTCEDKSYDGPRVTA